MDINFFQTALVDNTINLSERKRKYESEVRNGLTLKVQNDVVSSCLSKTFFCCGCFTTDSESLQKQRDLNNSASHQALLYQRPENETLFGFRQKDKLQIIGSWYTMSVFEEWEDLFYNDNMNVSAMRNSYEVPDNDIWYSSKFCLNAEITIWFGQNEKATFTFDSKKEHEHVYSVLTTMKDYYKHIQSQYECNSIAMQHFVSLNKDENTSLSQKEINSLVKKLNLPPKIMEFYLKQIPQYKQKSTLSMDGFMKLIELLQCPDNLYPIYQEYANAKKYSEKPIIEKYYDKYMSYSEFEKFQKDFQLQTAVRDPGLSFLKGDEREKSFKDLSFVDFCRQLLSYSKNAAIPRESLNQSKPLPHYFVNSSHNTYLVGNQITSKSSANIYYLNLVEGMRCVELDIHVLLGILQNGPGNEPIIKHGHTFTAAIKFSEAMKAIMKFCVQNPRHTPIILSFENHCDAENRHSIAKTLMRIPESKFYTIPKQGDSHQQFPSLKQLIGKIIIQGTGDFHELYPGIKQMPFQKKNEVNALNLAGSIFSTAERERNQKAERPESRKQDKMERQQEQKEAKQRENDRQQEVRELSRFYGLTVSPLKLQNSCWEMANIAENNVLKSIKGQRQPSAEEIYTYSWHSMIRVYPFGLRFDSSNFNPVPMLQCGCQLTSLNTQCVDINYVVTQGMFEKNEDVGFVLKRDIRNIRPRTAIYTLVFMVVADLHSRKPKQGSKDTELQVSFVGAIQDMRKNCRFVNRDNSPGDIDQNEPITISEQFMSKTLQAKLRGTAGFVMKKDLKGVKNEWYPEVTLEVSQPDFAHLYVNVPNCGSMGLPLKDLNSGIRVVPLYSFQIGRKKRMGNLLTYIKAADDQ